MKMLDEKVKGKERKKCISLAVDNTVISAINVLAVEKNQTKSEVIRKSILSYYNLSEFLSGGEHIVVDIDLWSTILEELNERGSENFWELVKRTGYRYGMQCKVKGLMKLEEILGYMEDWNWFRLKRERDAITLVLTTPNEQEVLKILLEGLCEALETPFEIVEGVNKVIIIEK